MRKKRVTQFLAALLLAGLLAVLPARAQKADPVEVLLQKAMNKQLVEGRLEEAIRLYKGILASHGGNRPVAAKALVQMGQCYEKLGKTEARKAYERVLREYPDQSQEVTEARERLAALAQPAESTAARGLVVRQVWARPPADASGAPSPDGRYLTYVHWETGDLGLHDLANGEDRRLTKEGTWDEPDQYAYRSVWSADSRQIAYSWFNKTGFELRIVKLGGAVPRVVYRNEDIPWIHPVAWTRDGKSILALFRRLDNTVQIVRVSVADGSVRVLKSLEWRYPLKMSLSPDDRYIVYDVPEAQTSPQRDIFLLAADGSREVALVKHPANDFGPIWVDGKKVLFASDRTGTVGAWVVEVVEGQPHGSPELVKADMGRMVPMGFTRKGSLYYGLSTFENSGDVYIASLDPATGKIQAPRTQAIQHFLGSNTSPGWSPDGKHLAYLSLRGALPQGPGAWGIVIRSVETGEERELKSKLGEVLNPRRAPLRWSPDGRFLLVAGSANARPGFYRVDVETGEAALAVPWGPQEEIRRAAWSPDGKEIVFFRVRQDSSDWPTSIMARDLETGRERVIHRAGDFALSPDGKQVAFRWIDGKLRASGISLMAAEGGEPRELVRFQEPEMVHWVSGLAWTPDSRHVLFGKSQDHQAGERETIELWRISADGGQPQNLGLTMQTLRDLSVHPDGRRIAFTAGPADHAEVWVMENFLAVLKASR